MSFYNFYLTSWHPWKSKKFSKVGKLNIFIRYSIDFYKFKAKNKTSLTKKYSHIVYVELSKFKLGKKCKESLTNVYFNIS